MAMFDSHLSVIHGNKSVFISTQLFLIERGLFFYSPVFHSPYNFMNLHYDPENATFDRGQRSIGL